MTLPVRAGLIGVGGMAHYHIRQTLKMQSTGKRLFGKGTIPASMHR